MLEFHGNFGTLAFIPHGHCYLWKPGLVWLHVLSDGLIALAYFSIPVALLYFVRQRRDLPYPWLFQLFGAFIVACGLTHAMEIWTLWHPIYWVSGALKSVTAIASLTTASALIPVIPQALALPTRSDLEAVKVALEISERKAAEAALATSKQRYQDLVENSPDIIERFDLQLRHLYVSPALTQITGIAAEDFLGKNCRDMGMSEPMVNTWEAAAAALLATGQKQVIEFSSPTLNGIRFFEMAIAPEWSDQQTIESILCISRDITERKQAEAALQTSEERLRLALTAARQGLYDLNLKTGEVIVSPEYIQMLNYDLEGFQETNAKWSDRLHPDERAAVYQVYEDYITGRRKDYRVEFRQRDKTGEWKWVLSTGKIVSWDEQGNPLRMIGTHTDISDLKQAEADRLQAEKLRLELNLLETLLNTLLGGYWDWDIPHHSTYMSPGLKRMFGYEDQELPNLTAAWQALIFAADLPGMLECFDRHIQSHSEIPYYNEVRYRHKDGTTVWVICVGQVIEWDTSGQPLRMIGCHVDITRLKQAEATLRQSEATNRALMSAIPDLVIWIDQDGTYLNALGSGKSLKLAKSLPEQIGANIYDLLPYKLARERMHYIQKALQTNEPQVYEYQFEIRGEVRDEEARIVLCGEHQVLCIVRDITDRKLNEATLLRTQAQLEASNRELEAFAYSVSHDLRSPLRAIDGFSKALLEDYGDQFDAEGKDYFDRIRHNVQRMGLLIEDLLNLSRISRSEMRYVEVNLSALVQEQIEELQASDSQRQVEFVVAPEAIVSADLTLMRVVISNLLENAWKFTSHRSSARIEFGIIRQDGQLVCFVSDNGAGFDMNYASMLFGVFQRLHNTHEFPGTGIGLATVQRVIHRHGGQIWAKAAVEQGAAIYFTISPFTRARA